MKKKLTENINMNNLSDEQLNKLNKYLMKSYEEKATELINFRVTPYERKILNKAALEKGMTITDMIKLFIIKDLYLNDD